MTLARRRPKRLIVALPMLFGFLCWAAAPASVRVAPMDSVGPRAVEEQTQSSIVRDYLGAWHTLADAFHQNRADLLDEYFVGVAKEKLTDTIREQKNLEMETIYRDESHDIQVTFYSPEGLSIQLLDKAEYVEEVRDHGKTVGIQHIKARYVAVLTPTESKWKVRLFQGGG